MDVLKEIKDGRSLKRALWVGDTHIKLKGNQICMCERNGVQILTHNEIIDFFTSSDDWVIYNEVLFSEIVAHMEIGGIIEVNSSHFRIYKNKLQCYHKRKEWLLSDISFTDLMNFNPKIIK